MYLVESCCTPITNAMGADQAEEMASLLKVLADPARLRIVSMLANADEVCVCDLTEPLDLSQPTVSHHMKVLREAGLVEAERRGKWIFYSLVSQRITEVARAFELAPV